MKKEEFLKLLKSHNFGYYHFNGTIYDRGIARWNKICLIRENDSEMEKVFQEFVNKEIIEAVKEDKE